MAPKPCSAPHPPNPPPRSSLHPPTVDHAGALGLVRSFERVKAEISQVPAHALVPIEIDVPRSARAVLGTAKRLATLLPDLAKLGGYDLRPVRRLRDYAGAAIYTHVLSIAAGPANLERLAQRDAAFVLFLEAYRHVRHGVMLLRWPENDAGAFLPELARRGPWALENRTDSRWTAHGTLRLEAAAPSPIPHREVAMG